MCPRQLSWRWAASSSERELSTTCAPTRGFSHFLLQFTIETGTKKKKRGTKCLKKCHPISTLLKFEGWPPGVNQGTWEMSTSLFFSGRQTSKYYVYIYIYKVNTTIINYLLSQKFNLKKMSERWCGKITKSMYNRYFMKCL